MADTISNLEAKILALQKGGVRVRIPPAHPRVINLGPDPSVGRAERKQGDGTYNPKIPG